ncbi:alpha/beta hydrolase [Anaerocolumna sp. MB42-C2]|uniref:alpha/beta hydrolase n=1 Tax=Anaerocolumna sp. MB42-C2 TaxID=3070997 RepID=UPI0027E1606A|nr:alpha/beta hydrolase [Anaerocolumna sp. MB42-C2]WMJ90111.1 alpha/beta hydrolase [Anaerocolumna sp. MB42-C2]
MLTIAKKFKLILTFTIVMVLSLSVSNNPIRVIAKSNTGNTTNTSNNKAVLEKRTSNYVSQFIKGNFDDFYKDSAEQIRKSITKSALKQGWDEIMVQTGKPGKVISCKYSQKENMSIVAEEVECTLYNIIITISYNSSGVPVGIWTNFVPKAPPKPQTSDKWEEIPVTVGEKKLPGMLTLPKGVQKPPVVIMIQGSGAHDMNESLGPVPNRPFEDIAFGLAEQGIATLRYNKSTYQYPADGGDTIEYEVLDDAAAAVKMLCNDKRVDTERIYLLGHSLGGMLAPKIANDNFQIKGFISMAGSLRSLQDIMLDQCKAAIDAENTLTEQQKNDSLKQIEAEIEKTKAKDATGTDYILGATGNYWKSLNDIDSMAIVKNLEVPMLILQGSADFQIYPDKDYKLWQTTLEGRNNVTYHLYEGLSHLFMPNQISANGIPDISVYYAPNHVEPQVIMDIAAWINGL